MSSAADIKRLNAVLAKVLDGMKPPEDVTVTEWAEKHRKLSSESSAEAHEPHPIPARTDERLL